MEILKAKFTYGTLERNLHNVKFRKLCKPALGFLREEAHPAPATQRLSHGNAQRIGVRVRLAEL